MSLETLLHPLEPAQFYGEVWEKRPFLARGEPERLAGLFSSRDMGRLLHFLRPRAPEGMLLVKGSRLYDVNWMKPDGTPHLQRVRAAWRDGYTIVVNGMESLWEPVARLAASLQAQLHHPVDANLYFTPPGAQGFVPHFDVMDVLVLQLEGSKVWQVRERAALPLRDEHTDAPPDRLPPLILEEELKPGYVLYMPRGFVHAARTNQTASLHLTVGINVTTWIDLFAAAVSATRGDERFRGALPPGFLNGTTGALRERFGELLGELQRHVALDGALAQLAEKLVVAKPAPPRDDLLGEEAEIGPDSVVARRPGVLCRVLEGPGYAGIQYSGGKIMGPPKIAPALRYIEQNGRFTLRSLPGDLNEREKVVLARRLIGDGLLAVEMAE
jgi:hypothetical protein